MWSFTHHLVLLLMTSAISSAFAYDLIERYLKCKWRFDDCEPTSDSSDCQVRFRKWCWCSRIVRSWCSREGVKEVNWTTAQKILISNGESHSIGDLCRQSNCTLVPGKCSWGSWVIFESECGFERRVRYREPCCHPLFSRLSFSCGRKREKETRSLPSSTHECNLSNITVNDDEISSDGMSRNDLIILVLSLIVGFVCIISIAYRIIKKILDRVRKRRTQQHLSPPQSSNRIIIPQPGQPLPQAFL